MGSPSLRGVARSRARRFVAGEALAEVLATVRQLVGQGFAVSVDRFGESLDEPEAVAAIVDEYLELGRAAAEVDGEVDLEVVPSHLGIDVSVGFFCEQARRVASALTADVRLQVSAEESHRTPRIVEAALQLAGEGIPVVATLQANLRRSRDDGRRLAETGVPIRLVKGAYVEPSEVAYPWGEAVDVAFVRLAHQLAGLDAELTLATHDPVIREALLPALNGVGVEMLLGVRPDDALELVQRGHHVRIYVPYGTRWFRYWMRRVAEARGA